MFQSLDASALLVDAPNLIEIPAIRPSLLDLGLSCEPEISPCVCKPDFAVLYLLNRPIAIIHSTPIDMASLDGSLSRIRCRLPRSAE
jgi:hypothetical protein